VEAAASDLMGAARMWRLWCLIAWYDIRSRYRRSTLGPFWTSISMAMQALVTAFMLGFLFKLSILEFLPYITISVILWNFIVTTVNEGATAFLSSSDLIMQVKRPFTFYILQTVWRNLILGAHNLVIFLVVAVICGIFPSGAWLWAIPGLAALILNLVWAAFAAGIFSARFGDVPLIVQNAFTMLFWLTPVLYRPEQLGGAIVRIVEFNPLYHILEIVRAPLLNELPTLHHWAWALATAAVGWSLTFCLLVRTRHRIAYWI
jgi:ABC-type polysaccharide/polyol phosphate export permease